MQLILVQPKVCYNCGSRTTKIFKTRKGTEYECWVLNLPTDDVLCYRCGQRFRFNKGIRAAIKLENRSCYACGATTSNKNKHGSEYWYRNFPHKDFLCHHCYNYILRKEYRLKNQQSRIVFKGKRVYHALKIIRIGICNLCRAVVGFDCKRTNMHHEEYDNENVLKHTIEVCPSCHKKRERGEI